MTIDEKERKIEKLLANYKEAVQTFGRTEEMLTLMSLQGLQTLTPIHMEKEVAVRTIQHDVTRRLKDLEIRIVKLCLRNTEDNK